MEPRLMTQDEIAEKYGADPGTVSLALSAFGIYSRAKQQDKKWAKRVYPENEAVQALISIFRQRQQRAEDEAEKWREKAVRAGEIYEEGE